MGPLSAFLLICSQSHKPFIFISVLTEIYLHIFRLALKAFTDQKRRFFPHLEDDQIDLSHNDTIKIPPTKQPRLSQRPTQNPNIDSSEQKPTLADILKSIETEAPGITTYTYQRLEWSKRAESLSSVMNDNSLDQPKVQNLANLSSNFNNVAVIELVASGIFRVLVSLHPAGSTDPDAVAFFSPNEVRKPNSIVADRLYILIIGFHSYL